ncbi:UNVERIFIED_CONTAM: Kinesin-like protein KIN-7C [Sesamum calycinum]|uniref:Kinesin-like protein n=1 Tax=Sesamum calycinum TaxID=2727403 RepID=A0AAW2R828_9LAMI
MGAEDLMNWDKLQGMGNGTEEKILVLVRLRPLSEKEIARNEVADWNASTQPPFCTGTASKSDRVFRGDCRTREVYDEGIKDIVLSVVGGINSTVFAYGQTSSGKTYTMNGITEYAVADIYDYIQKRGTIIEKLTEETLRDRNHLKELLSICEAQIGETSLNETSSRSHQILRLTIESSAREFIGKGNSTTLAASVNFVDLAGSERASQALSVGQRLKEGCHINRSLLTLGTVIRKLSKGRHGHINYRDSKLTRILQPALGGNARTAIICTLSPARSHVEQSRNTLLFASCAKEVSTNAKVNVVMSDKALVKHLQKEVARLESELRTPGSVCDHGALLRKKDMQIEKLEKEIRELKKQRDLAHSRIDDLLRAIEGDKDPSQEIEDPELGIGEDSDEICKEVRCIEMDESGHNKTYEPFGQSTSESEESMPILSEPGSAHIVEQQTLSASRRQVSGTEDGYGMLQQRIQGVQDTIDSLFKPHPDALSPGPHQRV